MPALSQERLLSLIGSAYDAALDGGQWKGFLAEFATSYGGGGVLFSQDMRSAEAGIVEFFGFDPLWVNRYVEHYSSTNLWLKTAANDPEGTMVVGEERIDRRTLEASEFYNDWLRPQKLFATNGTILLRRGDVLTSLSVIRGKQPGSFSAEDLAFWSTLTPHVRRAVQVHRELFSLRAHQRGALEALQALQTGALIADASCRLLYSNDVAERVLSAGTGLSVKNGRIEAATTAATASLQGAIKHAATPDLNTTDRVSSVLALQDGAEEKLFVLVCPVKPDNRLIGMACPTALLLIHSTRNRPRLLGADLVRLFGLTPAEAKLVCGLLRGMDLEEYARDSQISAATARSQLRQVFVKTDVHGQPALMRLVLTNPLLSLHAGQRHVSKDSV
jgi:DNA-binding CsgD family transcriptional regulator